MILRIVSGVYELTNVEFNGNPVKRRDVAPSLKLLYEID
jgi:hypothetical protein